jgi:hypothetical protein
MLFRYTRAEQSSWPLLFFHINIFFHFVTFEKIGYSIQVTKKYNTRGKNKKKLFMKSTGIKPPLGESARGSE